MTGHFKPYLCQTWRKGKLIGEVRDLSLGAARHIAKAHAGFGNTVRVWDGNGGGDYTEVYTPDGQMRSGTSAETTRVVTYCFT